ncbi:MAG: deoxyribose-phosphate aldolase [Coraliomargarita sp.]|nr:deoxyribose-phosphate aldolase [Coraliomargarita sp.]
MSELAKFMDATNLKLDSSDGELCALCDEAAEAKYASVCVYPTNVSLCSSILYNTEVDVCTVIGFPHGRSSLEAKIAEVLQAKEHGAGEVDIVLNYHALRGGENSLAAEEAVRLCQTARDNDLLTKIIVETCFLNERQKLVALKICEQAGATFIKTSTGFGTAGATVEDIALFRDNRTNGIQIKASGGIRDLKTSLAMIEAGATRLGVSAAGGILAELRGESVEPSDGSY